MTHSVEDRKAERDPEPRPHRLPTMPEPTFIKGTEPGARLTVEEAGASLVQLWASHPNADDRACTCQHAGCCDAEQHGIALDLPGALALIDVVQQWIPHLARSYAADHVVEAARAAAELAGEHLAVVVPMTGRVRPLADGDGPPSG